MKKQGKIAKIEVVLLAMTAVFLCILLGLHLTDLRAVEAVETEHQPSREEVLPDIVPLDINTATTEELAELPGIGEELARRIMDYRREEGPFETKEDIMKVSGIGEGKFAALEKRITVNGEETP